MILLLSTAFAQDVPFDPGKDGKKCDDTALVERHRGVRADLLEALTNDPVPTNSFEQNARLKRLHQHRKGTLCTREDMLTASFILLASTRWKDLERAYRYAEEAAKAGLQQSHWAATNAFDRSQVARARPQKFGTQFGIVDGDPRGCIYPVAPDTTDAQRIAWSVPPLQTIYASYLKERGHRDATPNEQSLRRLNLVCNLQKW